jgi:hypothetical protein
MLAVYVGCVAAVGWAIWWRLTLASEPLVRAAGLTAVAVVPLVTLLFVLAGPLQPGWSRRAGTPVALLGGTANATARQSGTPREGQALVDARFTGRLSIAAGPAAGERTITITGRTTAAPRERLVIVLHGTPSGDGVALTDGQVQVGQPGGASGFAGPVVLLQGSQLVATVTGPSGQRRAQFTLTVRGAAVTGTVSLLAATEE